MKRCWNPSRLAFIGLLALGMSAVCYAQEPHPGVVANLTRLHGAFEKYRAEHEGHYPPLAVRHPDNTVTYWPELLKPYLNDASPAGKVDANGPFYAPYVPAADRRGGQPSVVSFGYNRYGLGADAPEFKRGRRPVRDVSHPAQTLLLVECDAPRQQGKGWYAAYPNAGIDFSRYEGKAHVLFCDGRVELRGAEELNVGGKPDTNDAPWFGDLSKSAAPAATSPDAAKGRVAANAPAPDASAQPVLTVARISRLPEIDGRITPEEWVECAAFAGYRNFMTRRLESTDVTTFLGYDAHALYVCFIIPLKGASNPTRAPPTATGTSIVTTPSRSSLPPTRAGPSGRSS